MQVMTLHIHRADGCMLEQGLLVYMHPRVSRACYLIIVLVDDRDDVGESMMIHGPEGLHELALGSAAITREDKIRGKGCVLAQEKPVSMGPAHSVRDALAKKTAMSRYVRHCKSYMTFKRRTCLTEMPEIILREETKSSHGGVPTSRVMGSIMEELGRAFSERGLTVKSVTEKLKHADDIMISGAERTTRMTRLSKSGHEDDILTDPCRNVMQKTEIFCCQRKMLIF